ncbi:MAG: hypothetical protein ABSD57_01580 [Verrucomicrobiota bacterium]
MKTSRFIVTSEAFVLAAVNLTVCSHAQTAASAVVERGPNHCVWQKTTYETNSVGQLVPHIHQFTELATGLNYMTNGQWVESKQEIDILPNGTAAATQGQHQVYFPGDIYRAGDAGGQAPAQPPGGAQLR